MQIDGTSTGPNEKRVDCEEFYKKYMAKRRRLEQQHLFAVSVSLALSVSNNETTTAKESTEVTTVTDAKTTESPAGASTLQSATISITLST